MNVVRLSPEAIDELVEAAVWYRARRPGLESEFLAEFDRVVPLIGSLPVIFMDLGTEIRVLAVAHAKRRPGYWLDRVDK